MKLTYDQRYNIAYLRFHESNVEVDTIKVSDELSIDLTPDGTVYGIELLNANKQLWEEDEGKLLVIDDATGKRVEIPIHSTT